MWWWKKKIHISWYIALGCTGFLCGVAGSQGWQVSFAWSGVALVGALACLFLRTTYITPLFFGAAVVFGVGYGSAFAFERQVLAGFIGSTVRAEGRVKEDPSKSTSGSTSIQLEQVKLNGSKVQGFLFVSARSVGDVKRGDVVRVVGVAKEGFANFPLSISVPQLDEAHRSTFSDVGRVVRDWFADAVRRVLPEPQASLGIGFLTGQKSALATELSEAMKVVGLTHIVVASGYNLTILVQLARKFFLKISKYLSFVSAALMVLGFMAITGLSPSMTRAGLVSGMSLFAWYYGHVFHPFVLLPMAAALTIAIQPSYIWGDLGWQLSFAAFVGVMVVSPLFHAYFFGEAEPSMLRQLIGETLAAHAVTVPIIAMSFGTVSHIAIVANLLVVPLVPFAMLLTFLCGVLSLALPPVAVLIAFPTQWLLGYMVKTSLFLAEIPWAQGGVVLPVVAWAAYVLLLALLCWWMYRTTGYRFIQGTAHTERPP